MEGIPNALHQRIAAELSAPNPDVEFAFTAEEERAIFTYLDAATGVPSARKLSAWQEADYLAWAQNLRAADRDAIDISEVIAVCKAAMFHTLGLRPRDSQVISLLLLLEDGASAGRLLQISTGEGKSLIVAMFAAFQVLVNRETVDIMTSAPVLAVRDWTEYQYFFGNLSITSAHNTDNPDSTTFTKKCYEAEVVYGDMLHFIGDYLGDISHNVKMGRGFGVAIVDEVDNMFIDEISKKVQKASRVPGLEHLRKALVYMWLFQNTVLPNIQFVEPNSPRARIVEPVVDEVTRQIIGYKVVAEDINGIEFLSDLSYNFTLYKVLGELTLDENKTIVIPKYLDALAKDQLRPWVQSSIYARFFQAVNVTFVITNQSFIGDSQLRIVPVELDTGVLQFNMNIDDGVTQFLQIQNGLAMTSESLTSEFFSYPSYFLKYKGKLFGMTGTIGKSHCYCCCFTELLILYTSNKLLMQGRTTTSSFCTRRTAWTSPPCPCTSRRMWRTSPHR